MTIRAGDAFAITIPILIIIAGCCLFAGTAGSCNESHIRGMELERVHRIEKLKLCEDMCLSGKVKSYDDCKCYSEEAK